MSTDRPKCPKCGSEHTVKNRKIHNGKGNLNAKAVNVNSLKIRHKVIDAQTKELIDQLLLENLFGIARVTGVSKWLQDYVNAKYASVERQVKVSAKEKSD